MSIVTPDPDEPEQSRFKALTVPQMEDLFGDEIAPEEVMTPDQERRAMCEHYKLAVLDEEIAAMHAIGKRTGVGFEAVVIRAKAMVVESDESTSKAMAAILTRYERKRDRHYAENRLEAAVRRTKLKVEIQASLGQKGPRR